MTNREIDALVAEKVMGWIDNVWNGGILAYLPGKGFCFPHNLPNYSTDIAAAWQVLERLSETYPDISICKNAGYYECTLEKTDEDRIITEARTASMAICLAALKSHRR